MLSRLRLCSPFTPRGGVMVSFPAARPGRRLRMRPAPQGATLRFWKFDILKIDLACDRKDTTQIRQKPHAGVIKGKLPP